MSHDFVALTALALLAEAPHHPYEIQRLIAERHKDFARGKTRALYHGVERLQRDGLIEPVETSREGRRPERTVFRITEEGTEELPNWIAEVIEGATDDHPVFSIGLSFLAYLSKDRALDALHARVVHLEAAIAGLAAARRALDEQMGLPRVVMIEHEFTEAAKRAEVEWTRYLIGEIQSGAVRWDRDWLLAKFEEAKQKWQHLPAR